MELINLIDNIENACYSDKFSESVEEFNVFIELLSNVVAEHPDLIPVLKAIMISMEKTDYILMGDCLEYGVKPVLKGHRLADDIFDDQLGKLPDIGDDIYYYASYSEEPVLCVRDENGEVIRLNSLFSPINEVKKWVNNLKLNNVAVVCLFGMGTGLYADELLKRIPKESKLIIYEPNRKIFDFCLESGTIENCDLAEKRIKERIEKILSDDRVCLVIGEEDRASFRYKLEDYLDYLELASLVVAKHNSYEKIYPKEYLGFLKEINDHRIKKYTNKNTLAFFKEHFVEDLLKNMWAYRKMNLSSEIDKILPKDIPVIIVAAGPSLEKNIDILHQAKGHCLIFAVDTAVRFLLAHNIIPDLIITIDSIKPASFLSDKIARETPCVFDVTANPEILSNHLGRVFLFNCSNYYVCSLFATINKQFFMNANGGSVATAAFALMYNLGQKKIIMIGQDLASKNGITHAGGVNDGAKNQEVLVEGYYGDQVITRSDWLGYLKWFEKVIEVINDENKNSNSKIRVINATEGGAKIHGSEQMTLQEAIDDCRDKVGNLPNYSFENELGSLQYYLNDEEYDNLIINHNNAVEKLKEIAKKADEAITICKCLLKGINEGTVSNSYIDKEKKKITKIIEWCSRTTIFPLLNNYLITDVIDDISRLRFAEGDIKTTEKNGIELMKISFEAIVEASKAIYQKAKEIEKGGNNA